MNDWMEDMKRREGEESKRATERRRTVLLLLRQAEIDYIEWEYDGSDDSGNLEMKSSLVGTVSREDIMDIGYYVLERHFGGWEINEGSFGEMEWDIAEDKITIKHNHRIESSEYSEEVDQGDGASAPEHEEEL